jgi:hypothetical protein
MNRYGQQITWSTPSAPHPCTGICTGWSYPDAVERFLDEDESGDNQALIQHGRKAAFSFDAKVTSSSTDFLDLSAGAAIVVSGISGGVALVSRAVETWRLQVAKTINLAGTHFPDMTQASPTLAGALSAFTPTQSLAFMLPNAKLIWGTAGITHAAGIIHGLTLAQELTIDADDEDPSGVILGATAHGYLRTISLDIMTIASAAIPAVKSQLAFSASPPNCGNYQVETADKIFAHKKALMYRVGAVWIPPFGS